jgi:hypothetical protein
MKFLSLLAATCGLCLATFGAEKAITPDTVISLFNGRDLLQFYTWDVKHGKNNDVDRVFTAVERVDDAPAIRISGQHLGGIVTHQRYRNYKFVAEYRWGLLTWQPRRDKTRDGGVLFHCQGEIGNNDPSFRGAYMEWNRIEAICEGGDVTFFLNGVKVNEGRNGSHTEGPILIQSEGAEIFFRNLELHPLK